MTNKPLPDFDEYQDFPIFRVADDAATRASAIEHIDDAGVRAFLSAHPKFFQCDENAKLLAGFLAVRGGPPLTRRNLEIAYYDLREDGLLKAAPPPEPQPDLGNPSITLTMTDALAEYVPSNAEAADLAKLRDDSTLNDHQRKARDRKLALLAGQQRREFASQR